MWAKLAPQPTTAKHRVISIFFLPLLFPPPAQAAAAAVLDLAYYKSRSPPLSYVVSYGGGGGRRIGTNEIPIMMHHMAKSRAERSRGGHTHTARPDGRTKRRKGEEKFTECLITDAKHEWASEPAST